MPIDDYSKLSGKPVTTSLTKSNIVIRENVGLDGKSGFWWLKFQFDYELEKGIAVTLTNYKHQKSTGDVLTLEIEKCDYLGIKNKDNLVSFDIADKSLTDKQLECLQGCESKEKLHDYLETNVVPLIVKKIWYVKFAPQFRFFLSHESEDKPVMHTFEDGLKFLGYPTWLDKSDMTFGTTLKLTLKKAIEDCDCFVAWLNEKYFESDYCPAELLYAKKLGKVILPFGVHSEIETRLQEVDDLKFLEELYISNPNEMSFFEVLRRIDKTLFDFLKISLPSY